MIHSTRLERLASDKHSNLLVQFVSYEEKISVVNVTLYDKSFTIVICDSNDSTIVEPLL